MAILRRVRRSGSTGADAGTVLLRGFQEEHEPVIIVGRSTSHPKLVSFVADKTGTVKIVQWNLPPAESREQAMVRPTALRAAEVRPAISPSAHDACTNGGHLSRTWLTRPPVVVPVQSGHLVVFTRMIVKQESAGDTVWVEIRSANLLPDGTCNLRAGAQAHPLGAAGPKTLKASVSRDREEEAEARIAILRARPILPAIIDENGPLEAIVPDPRAPGRALVFPVPY
jgi:hypothetical protein